MRIFVTGASGWIGSAVVPELLDAGHQVLGLARSDAAAAAVTALGAEVQRGDLADLDGLRAAAAGSDGVVHLGYNHDFSDMGGAARTDVAAIDAFCAALAGTDRPLVIASGVLGLASGRVATEQDVPDPGLHPRIAGSQTALSFATRGVRSLIVRFAPTVHGDGDHGFMPMLIAIAREKGVSAYIGDGANRWAAVHRFDAATLYRLALEKGSGGTSYHAVGEQGVATREIAETIGRRLGLPVVSMSPEEGAAHFGFLGHFIGRDLSASSEQTRTQLEWLPTGPGLIADLDRPRYFES